MSRRLLLALIILGGGLLAACGGDDDQDLPPSIVITINAEPMATMVPGCEPDEVEAWYEVASTLIFTFKDDSLAALEASPEEVPSVINRLLELRDRISNQPAPECAFMTQNTILLYTRQVLTAFQRYANNDLSLDDLRAQVEGAARDIDTVVTDLLEQSAENLEQRLREERATQEAQLTPAS